MLDATLTATLKTYLERVTLPVELEASLNESQASAQTRELLTEIAALSDKITVTSGDDDRKPSFAIRRVGTDIAVRFAGVPLGHEFTSLVLALLQVGGVAPKISDEVAEQVRNLPGEHHFETYMSLTCQNCPDVVQALNAMSVLNPKITHVTIEGGAFQNEIEERKVLAVPTVYRNGKLFGQGRMTLEEIVRKLDSGAEEREAAALAAKDPFDVLVVGGGPAGSAAAIYASRKGIRTGVVVERFGGQVMDTMSIENFISVQHTEGPKLAGALEEHVRSYEVDVMEFQRAKSLTPAAEPGGLATVTLANGAALQARSVIISTGARWREMGVPGEQEYRNKGVTFCPHCDGPLFKGKRVAVIGGGNSGIEAAIDLAGVVGHVTVIEFLDELRADAVLVRKLHSLPNVDVILGAKTTQVLGNGEQVTGLDYEERATGTIKHVDLEGVFVQIGLLPNTEWLGEAVTLSPRKEIVIDERGATSAHGVFAAGDCTTVPYKQIVISLGAGATAALSAFDHLIRTSAPAEEAVAVS
ncbi:MAG: alkyl hydroperoxide reductase subunit F [Dermatophilaceae bacterium]|jgi:alkyl hydroperoxide reductase subunit F|nr:alkyl hydroperoxide reductase subunit F [Dermatophilaceae bacterium]MBP9917540.1 alkyl hydroperoxide reductase subunit F [Dermatophilaceae bacterium]